MFTAIESELCALSRGVGIAEGAGRVHSIFKTAINMACSDAMVVLLEARHADVPHGIRIASRDWARLDGLDVDVDCRLSGEVLEIPSIPARIHLSGAAVWHLDLTAVGFSLLPAHAANACATLGPLLAAHCARQPHHDGLRAKYLDRVERCAAELAQALRARDAVAAAQTLNGLIGLGCGLTPSGDDFIIGCLAGLALGACADAANLCFVRELSARLMVANTTPVSCQHLRDACRLRFARPLAELAAAVAGGARLRPALAAVLAVGGYSGADAASGLLAALEAKMS
jgi:hypothetical protein